MKLRSSFNSARHKSCAPFSVRISIVHSVLWSSMHRLLIKVSHVTAMQHRAETHFAPNADKRLIDRLGADVRSLAIQNRLHLTQIAQIVTDIDGIEPRDVAQNHD